MASVTIQRCFILASFAALLVACGGGGGGSSAVPATPVPTLQAVATPTPSPTPSPAATIGPQSANTIAIPSSNGLSGTLALDTGAAWPNGVTVRITPAMPGAPAPQARWRKPQSATAVALWQMQFSGSNATVPLTALPVFTLTSSTGTIVSAGIVIELFDATAGTAPELFTQNATGAFGGSGTPPSIALADTYYIEAVSGTNLIGTPSPSATPSSAPSPLPSSLPTPTPTPSPSPSPTPTPAAAATPFPGGATLVAAFTSNVPASSRSVIFTFNGGEQNLTQLGTQTALLQPNCAPLSCSATVSAPLGTSVVQAVLYASSNGSGTPLAVGTTSVTAVQNQATAAGIPLTGVMSSFTISLSPSSVTVGQGAPIAINYQAVDAAGDMLAPGSFGVTPPNFVTTTLAVPDITISIADASMGVFKAGFPGYAIGYSGIGSGPATISVAATVTTCVAKPLSCTTTPFGTASTMLGYMTVTPQPIGYAAELSSSDSIIFGGPLGSSVPVRTIYTGSSGNIEFDPTETLWYQNGGAGTITGVTPSGLTAGTLTLSGSLLAFDRSGNAYALGSSSEFPPLCGTFPLVSNVVNEFSVAGATPVLVRTITAPAMVNSAAPGPGGILLVGTASGVYEYPATGNGTIVPIAANATATGPVAFDSQGNVYASIGGAVAKWTAGTFGPAAPATMYSALFQEIPNSISVSASGDVYVSYASTIPTSPGTQIFVYPSGSTTGTKLSGDKGICSYVTTPQN